MIIFVALPNCRWAIECNGIRGPAADYANYALWPSNDKPELIGHSAYFGDERV